MLDFTKLMTESTDQSGDSLTETQENVFEKQLQASENKKQALKKAETTTEKAEKTLSKIKRELETGNENPAFIADLLCMAVITLNDLAGTEKAAKNTDKITGLLRGTALSVKPEDLNAQILQVRAELEHLKASRELADLEERIQLDQLIRSRERWLSGLLKALPAVQKVMNTLAKTDSTAPILCRIEKKKGTKSESLKVSIIDY